MKRFNQRFNHDYELFCYVTLRNKIVNECISCGAWGGDDTMFWFDDGSMLLERRIVKEFQLFKDV